LSLDVEGFCPVCRPKLKLLLQRLVDRLDAALKEIRQSEGQQLVPVGEFLAVVEGQLTGEQALIAEKIRQLEEASS